MSGAGSMVVGQPVPHESARLFAQVVGQRLVARRARRQQVQDRLPALLRQLGDRVRGVIGAHPRQAGRHAGRNHRWRGW